MSYALRNSLGISKSNCVVVFINQLRAKISTGYSQGPRKRPREEGAEVLQFRPD